MPDPTIATPGKREGMTLANGRVVVYGGGAFGREVAWLAQQCGQNVVCFIDDDETKPEVVYTSSDHDVNQDHRIVFEATLVASRPLPESTVRRVLCYETGYASRYGHGPSALNVFVDIATFLGKKLEAMKCYETELREPPHPRSLAGLELVARERGLSVGLKAAECFELVREIR